MVKAIWEDTVVAESDDTIEVDGYTYFPQVAIKWELLKPTEHQSVCGWKGTANYWSLDVGGQVNPHAAWGYREPKTSAAHVKDRVGFWRGVRIER